MTAMLCLARAIGIWSNEVVPTLMTRLAQIGLRPTVSLIAKDMPRCPMMVLCSLCSAHLTNCRKLKREHFFYCNVGFFNSLTFGETWYSFSAIHAIERISRLTARVNVMANTPSGASAMLAWVRRVVNIIFPRGICHEAMPFLR